MILNRVKLERTIILIKHVASAGLIFLPDALNEN